MTREEGDFLKNISFGQRLQYGTYQWFDHFFGRKTFFKNRTSFYNKLHETMPKHGLGRIMPIERRKDLSLKEFKEHYVKKGIPVVLDGAAKDWPCAKKWSMQYFKDLHGTDEIVLVDQNTSDVKYEHITFDEVYQQGLSVMDLTAFTLCKENNLPIIVFDMDTPGNLKDLLNGKKVGTLVHN